jgi:hypothetical protein
MLMKLIPVSLVIFLSFRLKIQETVSRDKNNFIYQFFYPVFEYFTVYCGIQNFRFINFKL